MTNTQKPIVISRKIDVANETVVTWKEYNALQMIALTAQRIVEDDFTIDNLTLQQIRLKGLKEYVEKLDKLENKIFKI
tara:strand:+ start:6413 stop:6646 length:234 start_codon:yes stop_codon:yes gene_type:complete